MKRAAPMLALCAALAACTEAPTAPAAPPATASHFLMVLGSDHHPPPPNDTSAAFELSTGETTTRVRVIYNLNAEGTAGYLRFNVQQDDNSFGTSNAQITFSAATQENPEGTLVGKGTLTIRVREGWVQLPLAKALETKRSFIDADCKQDTNVGTCGSLHIVGAKVYDLNGIPLYNVDGFLRIGVNTPPPIIQGPG